LDFLYTESYRLQIFLIDHIGLLPLPWNVLKSVCKQDISIYKKREYTDTVMKPNKQTKQIYQRLTEHFSTSKYTTLVEFHEKCN